MPNFLNIQYLQHGNVRQCRAYEVLMKHNVMELLTPYSPVLVGTIPIGIDVEGSDLDVICEWHDKETFKNCVQEAFSHEKDFNMRETVLQGHETVIANFTLDDFPVEVFGQPLPAKEQYGYLHMIAEYGILQQCGEDFKQQVIALKRNGIKTEPAFGQLLGLVDPYTELLHYFSK